MRPEEHRKALDEHLKAIERAIEEGVEEHQRNLGFNVSQASIEYFALLMHILHLVEGSGDQWDHRTFKSKKHIEKKVPQVFPKRTDILAAMEYIELERLVLCYGTRKPKARLERLVKKFLEVKKIMEDILDESAASH